MGLDHETIYGTNTYYYEERIDPPKYPSRNPIPRMERPMIGAGKLTLLWRRIVAALNGKD